MHPVDLRMDVDFNVANSSVQTVVANMLPKCHLVASTIDCSTKTRIRERPTPGHGGPPPLRSAKHPRGLPHLTAGQLARVQADNVASDFVLAIQAVMNSKGRGAFREHPRKSLHWVDPVEVTMFETGSWNDFLFDACCFFGARRKSHTIRHNLCAFRLLPQLVCGHWHSPDEWKPKKSSAGTRYPATEEAESTASLAFTLAVAASYWAADRGYAIAKPPRLPPIECAGDRRAWTDWDPSIFRAQSMLPTALFLGFQPPAIRLSGCPLRVHILDVWTTQHGLPTDVVYAGHGHFSHRLSPTKWENPFRLGADGAPSTVVLKYLKHWEHFRLDPHLDELRGKRLACPRGQPCHVDVILAKYFQRTAILNHGDDQPDTSLVWCSALRVVRGVPQRFTQEAAIHAIKAQFHTLDFQVVRWPMLEDILNQDVFTGFRDWAHAHELVADGPLGPSLLPYHCMPAQRASMHEQAGAAAHRRAIAPVVPFNLDPDSHFTAALNVQLQGCPLDHPHVLEPDLHYAATRMIHRDQIGSFRQRATALLHELSERLQPISAYIRSQQPPTLAGVNPHIHFALLALLLAMSHWPDTSLMQHFFEGFPAIGTIPTYGIWQAKLTNYVDYGDIFKTAKADAEQLLRTLTISEDQRVILDAGDKDEAAGWCTAEMTLQQLQAMGQPFRLLKRFVITQASGKKRVIDDAASGGQSFFSQDSNQLQFCSAVQPCHHLQALVQACEAVLGPWSEYGAPVSTFGEDLPDAYRKIPMFPPHSWACVVAYSKDVAAQPRFRRYHSMLFGLPLAVTAFNRLSFLCQSLSRRFLAILCSFYYDDATAQDWSDLAQTTQMQLAQFMADLGFPFADAKRQPPAEHGDFLGLVHDLSNAWPQATVSLWIRERLEVKIKDIINTALRDQLLHPGTAAKLYGCVTFMDQAVFGRIARAGLSALKDRQYTDQTADLNRALKLTFSLIEAVLRLRPRRQVPLRPYSYRRICGASDAAEEQERCSGGFLISTSTFDRLAVVVLIDQTVINLWRPGHPHIAQLELLMVFQALLAFPDEFRGASGVWYIDNIASLMALVRGRSENDELDRLAQMIHLLLFHLDSKLYFEWVQSASNWADGISRRGSADSFVHKAGFALFKQKVPTFLWRWPLLLLSRVFQYL